MKRKITKMSRKRIFIVLIFVLCLLSGCNTADEFAIIPDVVANEMADLRLETPTRSESLSQKYSVSEEDAKKYISIICPDKEYSIEPYILDNDTLLYLFNFDKGWIIVAGDKRINPTVAESEDGQMSLKSHNENLSAWIDCYADEISVIKKNDKEINNEYTKFWANISYISSKDRSKTRSEGNYKWVVITNVYCDSTSYYLYIPHLVETKWGQSRPWNTKLPIDTSINGRCVIGCVAVSMAQMIHYMHYRLGKPTGLYHTIAVTFPTVAGDTQNIGFFRSDYNSNSSRWDNMATDSTTGNTIYAQNLMIDVGNRLGMKYSGLGSHCSPSLSAISPYNLTYSQSSYNYQSVRTDLLNSKPVMVSAKANTGTGTSGHSWLIDGIAVRVRYYTITKHFEYDENWMYASEYYDTFDELRMHYHINSEFDIVEYNDTDEMEFLIMNWGFDGYGDDGYYSTFPSETWNYGYNYNYDKTIYYDFR